MALLKPVHSYTYFHAETMFNKLSPACIEQFLSRRHCSGRFTNVGRSYLDTFHYYGSIPSKQGIMVGVLTALLSFPSSHISNPTKAQGKSALRWGSGKCWVPPAFSEQLVQALGDSVSTVSSVPPKSGQNSMKNKPFYSCDGVMVSSILAERWSPEQS